MSAAGPLQPSFNPIAWETPLPNCPVGTENSRNPIWTHDSKIGFLSSIVSVNDLVNYQLSYPEALVIFYFLSLPTHMPGLTIFHC